MGCRLGRDFYLRQDVPLIAQDLLGKVLKTRKNGNVTAGLIVETEAYQGPEDKASHAFGNRRTERTRIMFGRGGLAYVYLCYGIHHLFNVVTGDKDVPHAVLIRAVQPLEGVDVMLRRRKKDKVQPGFTSGPGTLSQALGITTAWTGMDMLSDRSPVWIEDHGFEVPQEQVAQGPRIGIDYAEEYREHPWRFWIAGSRWVSRQR